MLTLDKLEFVEPVADCDVLAGVFHYLQSDGQEVEAKFYVRCCEENPNDPSTRSFRENALNEQFTDEWTRLQGMGCSRISFKNANPNPFF